MNVIPLGHRVLVDPDYERNEIEDGALKGMILTVDADKYEREKAMTQKGRVVAIGPTCWKPEGLGGGVPWCEVGDLIYFARYANKIVQIEGKEYFLINDEDVQMKIIEEEEDA